MKYNLILTDVNERQYIFPINNEKGLVLIQDGDPIYIECPTESELNLLKTNNEYPECICSLIDVMEDSDKWFSINLQVFNPKNLVNAEIKNIEE